MPIIFITGHGDVPMSVQAMKAGATEFLTKPFGDEILLTAIRHALERSHAALDREAGMRGLRDCYESLTRREREVMDLVVSGLLNKQVGGELGISELSELAASITLAGVEGAKVRASLTAKAAAIRNRQLADAETTAQAATERMSLPLVLLFGGFLLLIGFPAVVHVLTGI